ncbi:PD-(D/E)XK nuclease family protein [Polaribacter sp.]|uniref:PD-(D/E)XK nuclease family protein n=1 Tax=Polaribacter sp. TaxID=1920175 RepID=UPI003F6CF41F
MNKRIQKYIIFSNLLDSFSEMKKSNYDQQKLNFNTIYSRFYKIKEKTGLILKDTSSELNIFNVIKTSELIHSEILADFLNPKGSHGQGKLFLIKFLQNLGIENPHIGIWKISVELRNIDILLKRNFPKTIVIIENKSNWAIDQSNQLYRYWYQEMFKEINKTDAVFWSNNSDKYKILYLSPDIEKTPSENSKSRPSYLPSKLPNKIPLTVSIWSYNKQIVKWLENCLNELPKDNHRIKEYVKQYIEFWN